MSMPRKYKIDGLTLVELLVVMIIIGFLLAILLPAVARVFSGGLRKSCLVEIQQIETALALYHEDYRDYPPSTLVRLGLKRENHVNSGIEAVVLCLSSKHKSSTYFEFRDDKLDNGDLDSSPIPLFQLTGSSFKTYELFELTDPWGNPYIYFHGDDLLPTTQHFYHIAGSNTPVTPYTGESKTGNFPGYGKYQIISCGPDMKLHTEDDIRSN